MLEGKNNVNLSNFQYLANFKFWAFGPCQSYKHFNADCANFWHFLYATYLNFWIRTCLLPLHIYTSY